jgi:preprotein translocase subunit SecD
MAVESAGCLSTILGFVLAFIFGMGVSSTVVTEPVDPLAEPVTAVRYIFTTESDQVDAALPVLTKRLETLAIGAFAIEADASGKIRVELPPLTDLQQADVLLTLITPGSLELVDFSGVSPDDLDGWIDLFIQTTARLDHLNPADAVHPRTGEPFVTVLTSDGVERAYAQLSEVTQSWDVVIDFTEAGSETLGAFTATHQNEPLAIVLDGRVLSIPIIRGEIRDTAVIQSGQSSVESARLLAAQITAGPLPALVVFDTVEVIG